MVLVRRCSDGLMVQIYPWIDGTQRVVSLSQGLKAERASSAVTRIVFDPAGDDK
jgi:hypothetical protein